MWNLHGQGRLVALVFAAAIAVAALAATPAFAGGSSKPKFSTAKAFDVSKPLSVLARQPFTPTAPDEQGDDEEGGITDLGFSGDLVRQLNLPSVSSIDLSPTVMHDVPHPDVTAV